jgi:PAS domain S-box-containing protein
MDPREQIINEIVEKGIFDAIGDGISIQDTNFKILYQNDVHKKIIGNHVGEYCYNAYEKRKNRCKGCPLAETFKDGEIHTKERSAPTDKGIIYVEITSSPIKVPTGEIIAGVEVVRDVTERKKSENLIEAKEKFLNDVFDSIQDGISILDKDMNIVRVNKTMEEWYPHAVPLAGKKCYKAYHSAKESCEICPSKETLKNGKVAYELVPKRDSKGEVIGWLDLYSFPLIDNETKKLKGVIEYVRDITEQKNMENELMNRIEELEKFYTVAVNREIKMKQLKEENEKLKLELSKKK